jgi:MFS transporter, YQGE family, putative transporter
MLKLKLNFYRDCFSPGYSSLFTGRTLQLIGFSLIGLFLPIYLLLVFNGRVEMVFLFFLISYALYALFLPWGAQVLNKIGLRRSIRTSVFLFSAYFASLFFLKFNVPLMVTFSLTFVVLGRTFFWLPFNTDFAKFTDKTNRGKSLALLAATATFLGVIIPVVSGLLIQHFGYSIVFILTIAIYLCSYIPFLTLPASHENFSWSYLETIKQFLAKKNRKMVLSNLANGAENEVSITIWPIFIWQILNGNYLAVGVLSSLIVFVTIILQLLVGDYIDILNKRKMLHWGTLLYAAGWLAKVFVLSSFQIFIVGTYHNFTQIFKDTPFDTLNFELLADQGHYVDEFTVLREMAISLGKIIILSFAIFVALNFGLKWTFALAALASLFINLL